MRAFLRRTSLALALAGAGASLAGCQHDERSAAAQDAKEALGVQSDKSREKQIEQQRDVTVVKDTKVIDNATGEVLSDKKEATPVTVTKQRAVEKDVKVNVGQTQETAK